MERFRGPSEPDGPGRDEGGIEIHIPEEAPAGEPLGPILQRLDVQVGGLPEVIGRR